MTPPLAPETEAGRRLAKQIASWTENPEKYVAVIVAIEAEARERRERVDPDLRAVDALREIADCWPGEVARFATQRLLAILARQPDEHATEAPRETTVPWADLYARLAEKWGAVLEAADRAEDATPDEVIEALRAQMPTHTHVTIAAKPVAGCPGCAANAAATPDHTVVTERVRAGQGDRDGLLDTSYHSRRRARRLADHTAVEEERAYLEDVGEAVVAELVGVESSLSKARDRLRKAQDTLAGGLNHVAAERLTSATPRPR